MITLKDAGSVCTYAFSFVRWCPIGRRRKRSFASLTSSKSPLLNMARSTIFTVLLRTRHSIATWEVLFVSRADEGAGGGGGEVFTLPGILLHPDFSLYFRLGPARNFFLLRGLRQYVGGSSLIFRGSSLPHLRWDEFERASQDSFNEAAIVFLSF